MTADSASSHSRVSWASASLAAAPRKRFGHGGHGVSPELGSDVFWASVGECCPQVMRTISNGAMMSVSYWQTAGTGAAAAQPASDNPAMHASLRPSADAPPATTSCAPQRLFGRWWRRQSPARQDRFATLGPLVSVLLFLAAIISAFWYLRNEEFEREHESVKRDTEIAQQQIRLRLIENQEQLVRMAREIVTRAIDADEFLARPRSFTRERPEITQPDLDQRRPQAQGQLLGDQLPRRGQHQRRRHADPSLPVEGRRERSPRRAFIAARDLRQPVYSRAVHRRRRHAGVPGPGAADRPQRVRRHADRRVLGRRAGALLRARRGDAAGTRSALLDAQRAACSPARSRRCPGQQPQRAVDRARRAARAGRPTACVLRGQG